MANPKDQSPPAGMGRHGATVIESVEEIRAQIRAATLTTVATPVEQPVSQLQNSAGPKPFRPNIRPPMALLTILDDGDDTGEIVRVRAHATIVGRVDGDIVIGHDNGISSRHAEISRRSENGEWAWYLKDLQSTNGTFVRTSTVLLSQGQELLIGRRRFRFEAPATALGAVEPAPVANATQKWESLSRDQILAASRPELVDISPGSLPQRFPLPDGETFLGRDASLCSIIVEDDLVDRRHARLFRDAKGRWVIANLQSRNGLWARVQEVKLGRGAYFQCGEQRFLFKSL